MVPYPERQKGCEEVKAIDSLTERKLLGVAKSTVVFSLGLLCLLNFPRASRNVSTLPAPFIPVERETYDVVVGSVPF